MDILSFLLERQVLALLLFIIVSIVVAIVVVIYQKKPVIKEAKEESYQDRVRKLLRNKTSEQKLALMESLFKEFLAKKYNIHEKLDFYDIEKKFETDAKISDFCKLMIEAYYSGETVTESVVEKILQSLERILAEEKHLEKPKEKKFGFFKSPEKKYYEKHEQLPLPPEKQQNHIEDSATLEKDKNLRHGRDQHDNISVFADKEKAAHAKHHLQHAKHHIKNIHHSLKHSKHGTLNENLSIADWENSLGEIKSDIINDCKKVLSKI